MVGEPIDVLYVLQPSWLGMQRSISALDALRPGMLGSAVLVLGEHIIGAPTVEQISGSISSTPSIVRYNDGYWASIVHENRFTIISSDIPPVRCPSTGECSLEVVELDREILSRISSILGIGVEKILMLCVSLMGICSGVTIKILVLGEPGEVVKLFSDKRGEVFRLLAETYGSP